MNKIALITGGSRGLGRDTALQIAKSGIDVILTYHSNQSAAAEVVEQIISIGQKATALPLDVANSKEFDRFANSLSDYLVKEYGKANFDFLINNAGAGAYGTVSDTSEETFDTMMNVHFKSVYFFTQKMLPLLNDGGSIISISSALTRIAFPNVSAYASVKGAIETYTKCLAKELGERKITANVVAPGAIATDFGGGSTKTDEGKRKAIAGMTALGRVGEAEDVGGVVAFLCSPEAKFMTGQRLEISGGMMV